MEVDHFFKSKKQFQVKKNKLRPLGRGESTYGSVQTMVWEEESKIKD